jgi:hypothetical protein
MPGNLESAIAATIEVVCQQEPHRRPSLRLATVADDVLWVSFNRIGEGAARPRSGSAAFVPVTTALE